MWIYFLIFPSPFTEPEALLEEKELSNTSLQSPTEPNTSFEEHEASLDEDKYLRNAEQEDVLSDVKSSPFQLEPLELEGLSSAALSADEERVEKSRRLSATSDDLLYEDSLAETRNIPGVLAADDQDVLLELNTEDQEQFEVLDSAEAEEVGKCKREADGESSLPV